MNSWSANEGISGVQALAEGAVAAGVSLVTGYPGSPATAVVEAIVALSEPDKVQVEWTSNEKVALEMAFGASVAGKRALLAVKGVGMNIALDPLMVINLSGCNAGLVLLVGDDPGSWGSQNEQDSRILGVAAEIPVLEPATVQDAYDAIRWAFGLSEETGLPVMVRFTQALAAGRQAVSPSTWLPPAVPPPAYQREFMRWVVLPINAVPLHRRLLARLAALRTCFENSPLNGVHGQGQRGIVAAGYMFQKLMDMVGAVPADLRVFRLGTFHPLPVADKRQPADPPSPLIAFLQGITEVLVLEDTAPLVERAVRAAAQSAGLTLPIYGRDTGHVPIAGELLAADMAAAISALWPSLSVLSGDEPTRSRPSRVPLCDGCPYIPAFDALSHLLDERGGRDSAIVVGDPGCMVRAQLPPMQLFDVKHGLGASIGMAAGLALGKTDNKIVAVCGDSAFLHTGLNGLIDAVRVGARLTLLVLDNHTTALSGGQPHPGSQVDARGQPRPAVNLADLARAAGAESVQTVDLDAGENVTEPIRHALALDCLAVVIVSGRCPRWSPAE